jgi:DNA-binding NtrC family response regulator
MTESVRVLVIDDDDAMLDSIAQVLHKEGFQVRTAPGGKEALEIFNREAFHCVFLDLKLPGIPGLQVLSQIKEASPETPVVLITGYGTIESAVEAIKLGAFNYVTKPFTPEELRVVARKALDSRRMHLENISLRTVLRAKSEFEFIVGQGEAITRVLDIVGRVSPTETTILITGESGTGKELIAREIHRRSARRGGPFIAVDCGALVETLFESELFGHVKGSFTGAHETKHGRFELAEGGTIFFDEISNISLNIQAKLLRVFQEREVTRIGSTRPIKVDARILAATNENLAQGVRAGTFREDLFYRLNVVPIHLPPLRERKEDIPLLVSHFLQKYNKKTKRNIEGISPRALKMLTGHDWPGNIRELENTIERAVVLSRGNEIDPEDLICHGIGAGASQFNVSGDAFMTLEEMEKEYIRTVIRAQKGNKTQAAQILGVDRKTLWAKTKKYGLG